MKVVEGLTAHYLTLPLTQGRQWWVVFMCVRTFGLLLNKGEFGRVTSPERLILLCAGGKWETPGVEDRDWGARGLCGSHITPLQLFSTCHMSTLRTQQQSQGLDNFKCLLCWGRSEAA